MSEWLYTQHRQAFVLGTILLCLLVHSLFGPLWAFVFCLLLRLSGWLVEPMLLPDSSRYGPVICRASNHPKKVALTFDDGPAPDTPALLDALKRMRVRATFFLIGSQVVESPELVARLAAEGHCLANHTFSHSNLLWLDSDQLEREISQTSAVIEQAAGRQVRFFRPPYGYRKPAVHQVAERLGLRLVNWSVNPRDFLQPGPLELVGRVMAAVQGGDIVLLHDGRRDRQATVEAVPLLIRALRRRGFELVTLDELLGS